MSLGFFLPVVLALAGSLAGASSTVLASTPASFGSIAAASTLASSLDGGVSSDCARAKCGRSGRPSAAIAMHQARRDIVNQLHPQPLSTVPPPPTAPSCTLYMCSAAGATISPDIVGCASFERSHALT